MSKCMITLYDTLLNTLSSYKVYMKSVSRKKKEIEDKWILSKLNTLGIGSSILFIIFFLYRVWEFGFLRIPELDINYYSFTKSMLALQEQFATKLIIFILLLSYFVYVRRMILNKNLKLNIIHKAIHIFNIGLVGLLMLTLFVVVNLT